jgi:hypothetical protein
VTAVTANISRPSPANPHAMWRQVQVWLRIQISRPRSAPSLLRSHARPLSSTAAMGAAGQQTVHTTERLARLRELMKSKDVGVQAVVVPSEDERACFVSCAIRWLLNSHFCTRFQRISRSLRRTAGIHLGIQRFRRYVQRNTRSHSR